MLVSSPLLLDDRVFGDEVDTRAARGRVGDGVADVLSLARTGQVETLHWQQQWLRRSCS